MSAHTLPRTATPRPSRGARLLAAGALLALGSSLQARADPVFLRHDRSLAQAAELAAEFPAVVRVGLDGSGTLVAPRWVLTAAHVAEALSPFSPRVHVGARAYAVRDVHPHPEAVSREFGTPPDVDLALLELAEPVEGVEPVALEREGDAVGREVILVGHGDHALAGGEPSPPDGVARAATNEVDRVDAQGRLFLRLDRDGTELEGVGAPGDSGGPLLTRDERGLRLLGVSSGGFGPLGDYGMQDMYASVPRHRAWIEAVQRDAEAGEASPRTWLVVDAPPADAPAAQLAAAFFAALRDDSPGALRRFAKEQRSAADRACEDDASWSALFEPLRELLPADAPTRWAVREGRAVVLTRLDVQDGWVQFDFRLDGDGKLDLLLLGPGAPPEEPGD